MDGPNELRKCFIGCAWIRRSPVPFTDLYSQCSNQPHFNGFVRTEVLHIHWLWVLYFIYFNHLCLLSTLLFVLSSCQSHTVISLNAAILKTHNVQTFNHKNYFAALINMDWTVYCIKWNEKMKSTFTVNLYIPILVTYSVNKSFCIFKAFFLCILTPGYVCSFHHPQDAIFNRWERVC